MNQIMKRVAVAAGALTLAVPAFADGGIDVSAVVSTITTGTAAVAAIGAAALLVFAGAKIFKWVRAAF